MSKDAAINVEHVNKTFRLPHEKNASVKSALINFKGKRTYEKQRVLKDISFEVRKGEFFGIIGRNGSGKSTLLKILAGVYSPSEGGVHINGSLTPFIELGVGFNPELSGRENVYLNGALLGFSRKEMNAMYDDIVDFAELKQFMDQKLKNYSSGMQVRLAFSIAIKAKSDILLIDEVLAVGDEAFQRKCLDVFERYKAEKQTIILVTHDMATVRKFCNRALLINDGVMLDIGDPRVVAEKYSKLNQDIVDSAVEKENKADEGESHVKASILNASSKQATSFGVGDSLFVDLEWEDIPKEKIESIGINIFKLSGEHITGVNTRDTEHTKDWRDNGRIGVEFKLSVAPGRYYGLVEIFEEEGKVLESIRNGLQFSVTKAGDVPWSGLIELPYRWYEKK